jgi:LEA14-like dessication related protein
MKRLLLLVCSFLTGCTMFMAQPEVMVKDVSLAGLDRDGVEMDLGLTVTNPNSSSIRLSRYSYNLLISELPMTRGEQHESFEFKGNTTTDIRLPLHIRYNDLLEILKRIPDPDHIPYQLTADFDLNTQLGTFTVPVAKRGNFAIPQNYRPGQILKKLNDFFNQDAQ